MVILTGHDTLMLMTKYFDAIVEKNLNPDDFGENKPITVGWGSKETQFHGSEGKDAAKIKTSPTQEAFPWDDQKVRVSWRGDGQMFVVSSVDSNTGSRKLRIWNRDGSLLCTSEAVNGLEQALHWKPSGSVIASTLRTVNKHEVIFFEKNGLRHREFLLKSNPKEYQVKGLSWNGNSSILAIWGCDLEQAEEKEIRHSVMLWTVNNYHWYQKQTLEFGTDELHCVAWDPFHHFVLHCVTNRNHYIRYRWTWTTNCSFSYSNVAVIDGEKLLVTPLGSLVVPPPLSAYDLCLSSPVNQVMFSLRGNDLILCLADNRLAIFKKDQETKPIDNEARVETKAAGGNGFRVQIKPHSYVGTFSLNWENENKRSDLPLCLYHWIWLTPTRLMCVTSYHSQCYLVNVHLTNDGNQIHLSAKLGPCVKQHVLALVSLDGKVVYIQRTDGVFLQYDTESEVLGPFFYEKNKQLMFPQPCETLEVCKVLDQVRMFGLTNRFRLFCDRQEVANDCTSFQIHDDFLLMTTYSHTLRCLLMNYDLPRILSGDKILPEEDSPRALERGSRIVAAVSSDTKVVLQMPRGNLETIHPRALVLFRVRHYLENLKYGEAFTMMKKHRINLNLLYDDNPKRFDENVATFVTQLGSAASLNIFLNELQEEDMSKTMYAMHYRNCKRENPDPTRGLSKLDAVCNVVRTELLTTHRNKYFLSILTTYVKMTEPQLDTALMEIKKSQALDADGPSTDEALRYLMYMVDVNELYNVALSTYDFDIVLMVAEKSQKDPKEYLMFLNDLKKLEPQYQKFKIDMHLHNYKKALINISQCGDDHFDELLSLVKTHRLYTDALFLYPLHRESGKILWKAYGNYLMEKKYYEEAGLVYDKCQSYKDSLDAHQKSLNWQMALCAAVHLGYTAAQMAELSKNIAGNLRMNRRYVEAANLYEHYAQDIEESIATLLDGHEWSSALSMIYKHGRLDLLETHLKPQLETQSDHIQSAMDQIDEDFTRHSKRLQKVREDKERLAKMLEDNDGWRQPDADLFSDTSSITGQSESSKSDHSGSIATRKTSRRKKQRELKKYSLKEGSAHEDLALIVSLSELIKSADDMQETMSHLLKMLVAFDYLENARGLQKQLDQLLSKMKSNIPLIWPPETEDNSLTYGPSATTNSLVAALQKQKQAQPIISDPLLRIPPTIRTHVEWKCFLLGK